jgi:hypothetical protein
MEGFYMKKIIVMLIAVILMASSLIKVNAATPDAVTLKINGSVVNYTPAPFVDPDTNRTLVPLRVVSEKLGASVEWDGEFRIVTIKRITTIITIKIGNSFAYKGGERKTLDQPAVIVQDRTFVPLRFVSEAFGAAVDWDEKSKTVSISLPMAQPGVFVEPKIEVVYPGGDYDPFYFAIVLSNNEMYQPKQFEIRTHIDNYPFNTIEYPLGDKWYSGKVDNWMPVYPGISEYYTLKRKYYTTRADNVKVFDGMQVQFTVSLKQISTGKVKDYKGTATIKLK